MEIVLTSGNLTAKIKTLGAELISLRKGDVEYLWQGDPAYWSGQSPLLFPNVGRYWDNTYRYNGQVYEQGQHGFARTTEFTVVEQKADQVTLGMHSTEETEKVYPFQFFLFVTYRLSAEGLSVEWFVRNQGENEMYFQIGAHPAFYMPGYKADDKVHGYFSFESRAGIPACDLTWYAPTQKGCMDPEKPLEVPLDSEGMLPIEAHTFDCDTYIIDSKNLQACTLLDAERKPWVTVKFDMPILALWSPTVQHSDCPFVCIEPWCGSCDAIGYDGDISTRLNINALAPGAHFLNTYQILLNNQD